jgi:hypothetical protein
MCVLKDRSEVRLPLTQNLTFEYNEDSLYQQVWVISVHGHVIWFDECANLFYVLDEQCVQGLPRQVCSGVH